MAGEQSSNFNINVTSTGVQEVIQDFDQIKKKQDEVSNADVGKSVGTLKQQLRDAKNELSEMAARFGATSKEAATSAQRVAQIKDEMEAANTVVRSFNPDNKMQLLVGAARTATVALQGASGAMAFLGVSSETAAETMAKLQGLMAFSDALNSIGNLNDFWKGFIATMGKARTATIAQTAAQGGATIATKAFGVALKAVGIGLVITAIATLISYWDDLKDGVSNLIPGLKNAGETFDRLRQITVGVGNAIVNFVVAPIKFVINLLKGDFKKAIADFKKDVDVVTNFQSGVQNELKRQNEENQRELLKKQIKYQEDRLAVMEAGGKKTYDLEKKILSDKRKLHRDDKEELDKLNQEERILEAKHQKELSDERKRAQEKSEQERKARAEKQLQARQKELEDLRNIEEQISDLGGDLANQNEVFSASDGRNKELTKARQDYDEKKRVIDEGEKKVLESAILSASQREVMLKKAADARLQLEEFNLNQIAAINRKFDEEEKKAKEEKLREDKRIEEEAAKEKAEALEKQVDARLRTIADIDELEMISTDEKLRIIQEGEQRVRTEVGLSEEQRNSLLKAYSEARLEIESIEMESKQKLQEDVSTIAETAADLAGRNTAFAKGLGIAQTTIETWQSASGAYKSQIALATPDAPVRAAIAAAAAVAQGLARVKSILAVKVPNKDGGTASATGASPSVQQAPTINATNIQLPATQDVRVVNQQDRVVKAYVAQTDLQTAEQKASFMNKISSW